VFNWIIGIPLLALFASAALVLAVIPSTRHKPSRLTLNVLLVLVTVWTFCSVMFHSIPFPSTLFWLYLILVCGTYTGAVGMHFTTQFTGQNGAIAKWLVAIFYILSSLLLVPLFSGKVATGATLLPNGAVEVNFGPMAPFMWGVITFAALAAIAILILALVRPRLVEGNRYTIFPLVGFIVMCFGGLSNLIVSHYPVDIAANFIFIVLVNYAVLSRHILRSAQKQSWWLSLSVTGFILALCYAAMFTFCLKWVGATTITSHLIAAITVIIFGSVAFGPSREFLSKKLIQYLFPNMHRYRKAVSDLSSIDTSVFRWTNSVSNILNIIAKATSADNAILLVRNSDAKDFEAKYAVGRDSINMLRLRWPGDSPLVKALVKSDDALSTDEIKQQITFKVLLRGEDNTLQEIGPTLSCGVQGYDGILAIVALTRKSPYVWDQTEDKDFLKLACGQIAPLIINANLYQESQLELEKQKRMQEALKASETRYRTVARLSSDFAYSCIHNGNDGYKIDWITDAFYTLSGYSESELHEQKCWMFVSHPDDYDMATEPLHYLKAGETNTREFRIVTKDGRVLNIVNYMECQADPQTPGGLRLFGAVKDITERKRAEEERLELERKIQINSRLTSIGEMAAGIAHEINNPLTPILGFADMLLKRDLPEDVKDDLQIIRDSARRTADVTRRLLLFARQSKPMRTLCNINEVVETTLQLRAYHLKTNNIKVITELDLELPQTMADAGQLQQVVLNLIMNAEYAMTQTHGGGNLLIKTEKKDNIIRVLVKDDGVGISKENMERLFQPFFTTKKVSEGTGLGLSVCHGIVAEHNGRIYAESKVGKGATFIVELPVVRQEKEEEAKLSEPDTGEAGEVVKARILVVDDEPAITQVLKRVLTDEGYEVEITGKAQAALGLIKGGKYALILLDIKLPDMSGIELYQHLDKTAMSLTQRIIFITGDVLGTDTMDFFSRTGASYVTKPFDMEQLKKEVKSKLTKRG
jgi:PAS domain S-box-containing protein